jgi:PAS domain S-box-containing protein
VTKRPPNPTWFQASGPDTVLSSEALRETFDRAQEHVRRYFSKFVADPATGRIEINDDRYVLVRASALSTDFFDTVTQHYDDRDPGEAAAIARSFLFDIAHTIGKNDARAFHAKVVIDDPIDRLCTGPVCFAYSGWALVDIGDALPMPGDDDYLLTYDHPYSFEADSWLRKGRTSDTPVCVMNAGYSAGWSEESFGIALTAVEVKCRARGDDACTFVMAPPHRIHDHLRELYPERAAAGAPIPFERKSEEDALRRSERRLRSILAATPMPVLITREDGTLLYGNEHAHHVFGLAADHTTQVSALFERDGALDELLRANRDGERILGVEHRMLDAAGEPFSALVSCHGILLPDGESGMVVTALDVTDYKRTEAALRVNERMATVGTLAAGVAHEINNPLSYVIANLERLAGQARRGEVDPAAIDRALEGALRVRDIVRDLRSLSRDRPAEVDEAVDVEAVLDSAIAMASVEWRHRAEMVRDYAGLPPIRGNGGRIGQVFLNLLVNAAQAIVEGAASTNRITATTRCDGDRVSVEIADTGAGIAAAELSRIFDPFFTTKGVGEGTGLGLTITRNIVSELGGEIRAESEPGRGTAVTVTLPASPPPDRAGADLDDEPVDLDNLRILIVDDEEPLTDVLVEMLDECAVTVATSGRAARARLGETCFDVVLCDLMMPDVTGMELYRTVPVEVRDRIIFMTGGAFTSSAASFLDTIDNLCLEKPIELRVLRRAIHSHVSGQRG